MLDISNSMVFDCLMYAWVHAWIFSLHMFILYIKTKTKILRNLKY